MEDLNPAEALAKILAACADQPFARGGLGPGSRLGESKLRPIRCWLGLLDLTALPGEAAELIAAWATERAAPLLMARNLFLARPWMPGLVPDTRPTPLMEAAAPPGWLEEETPVLLLVPSSLGGAGTTPAADFATAHWHASAHGRARKPDRFWARTFDVDFALMLARLSQPAVLKTFRDRLSPAHRPIFKEQLPRAEAEFLDDLVGARDETTLFAALAAPALEVAGVDALARIAAYVRSEYAVRPHVYAELIHHSGASMLAPAALNEVSRPPPPMPAEFADALDQIDAMLFDEERERLWAAHWRAAEARKSS